MKKPLETEYLRAFLVAWGNGLGVTFFRRNTGLVEMRDGRRFRAGVPGQCDLYGIGPHGRHYELEVKRFGKLSPPQEVWLEWCRTRDVPWLLIEVQRGELPVRTIARWVEEVTAWIRSY
jgi:hypothetical protein